MYEAIHEIDRTATLNLLNGLGNFIGRLGIRLFGLNAEAILEKTARATGFSFEDTHFRAGLDRLVEAVPSEAGLNTFGSIALKKAITRSVQSRVLVEREIARNPNILAEPISEPVFIIGMPRTGTTILHALLYRDSEHRAPLCWECLLPHPSPTLETYRDNPRIEQVSKEFEQLFKLVPDFRKMHYMEVDAPQECVGITALNMTSYQYLVQCAMPSYLDWLLRRADQRQNMVWHKRFLQFLQSGGIRPKRWLLKSPLHLMRLDAIFEVYPDARVIMTHRDPEYIVPSMSSLVSSVRSLYSDREDASTTARELMEFWAECFDRFLQKRRILNREEQVIDLSFDDFAQDQMHIVDRVYARFGWELDEKSRARMREFLRREEKDKHGKHEYSLEQFGISRREVRERYANYIEFIGGLPSACSPNG